MKQLEAFTLGKKFGQPQTNEDSLVILPGLGYAVIDGVTDRNGTRYDDMLSGQFASRTVKRATELFLLAQQDPKQSDLYYNGPEAFITYLSDCIKEGYRRHGVLDAVEADWKLRGGCTIMAALIIGDRLEVIAVGDSGIRINGTDTLQVLKPLDDVTAILRREAWHYFEAEGLDLEERNRLAGLLTWRGTRNQETGERTAQPEIIAIIEERAFKAASAHLSNVPEVELRELIEHGISYGQGNFQNVADRVLGYGGLDGFPVEPRFVESRTYALADVHTIELFSDGYFKLGDTFGVTAWEKAFAEVEAEDPHKIAAYMSTKGTTDIALTDDRSYLGVKL
ncbi:PP2C family serine/threonine-protein phosphatase [Mariluticola halotolerans]|uniref:PP2C family serine/threonine-protein phosphatase n=1 Tax=Mariluticola halotolerans TaxID=2909283 RepID=UPI0026E2AFAC|nr:PP2C family serine/threonine-protein phosphatase [Mariluticola halotolerans]UJQ94293.1 protein phosphatase 2C family protein [Mariluticola halotolerans]